jgi:GAF domain-containing protein
MSQIPRHSRKSSLPTIHGVNELKVGLDSPTAADRSNFEKLDEQLDQSATFQYMWKIVRMVSAQPSFLDMTKIIENEGAAFVGATSVRFITAAEDHLVFGRDTFPVDEGIVGFVYKHNVIVNLKDPHKDKRFSPALDQDSTVGTAQYMMCLPVVADSTTDCRGPKIIVGIVVAVKAPGSAPFDSHDCTAFYRLGQFAGNSMRNAMRLDRAHKKYDQTRSYQQRSHALLDIAKALSSENRIGPLVSFIVSQVPELLDCDRCTLFFVDKEHDELVVTRNASHGRARTFVSWIFGQSMAPELPFPDGMDELRFPLKRGIAGYVGLSGKTINITDAHQDHRFNPEVDKSTGYRTRSILCMPLVDSQGDIIGVVQAINKNPAFPKFNDEDEMMLATFAAQAAIAVKNAKLFQQTEAALRTSDALLEITTALSQELKLMPLLRLIVGKVQKLLDAERCTVFLVDQQKRELYTSDNMSFGMGAALPIEHEKTEMIRFPMERGIAGSVATTGEPAVIPDAYSDPRFNRNMDKKTGFRTRTILCLPIRNHSNEIIGVTQVINKTLNRVFNEEDIKLLGAFNAQAAVAIENSRLFTQTERALNQALAEQRNLKFLLSVTKNLFSDMHLSSMIEQMTMQVHHLLKADDCALFLVEQDTKEFYLAKDETDPTHRRHPFSVGIVGTVASSGRTIRISRDAFRDPRFNRLVDQRKGATTHSILCCPITAEGPDKKTTVIGVISVRDEKDRGGFEREEENLLKVFCAQAAVAIINSKRFGNMLESSDAKDRDQSAAEYLVNKHGMNLASDDIDSFQFTMDEITLVNPIGTGSYGEVYRAKVRNKTVAVKKLHVRQLKAEQVDSFCNEAALMCQLHHQNVVLFIGAVTEPSNLCIITEFCARGSLADLLLDHNVPMTFARKLKFAEDAARGMLYLHGSNPVILHRDLKSDNLLVGADWTVKVADFGLTRFLSEKKAMTQVGTPMWMAPEIIMGKKYTEKADVYAFGIILWEVLTRLEPYDDKEPMQIVVEVVNNNLRPTIPHEHRNNPLVPLMKDCWHKNPEERPTFKAIVERLEEIVKTNAASS